MCVPGEAEGTAEDTIEFQLKVKCTRNPGVKESTDPDELYKDHKGLPITRGTTLGIFTGQFFRIFFFLCC